MKFQLFPSLILLLFFSGVRSDAVADTFGKYSGVCSTPSGHRVDMQVTVSDGEIPGTFEYDGIAVFTPHGSKRSIRADISGDQAGKYGNGRFDYVSKGKNSAFKMKAIYVPQVDGYAMGGKSGTFGDFACTLFRRLGTKEMVGIWSFNDGTPMTVRAVSGGKFQGNWTGINGHTNLHGQMKGTVADGFWSGQYILTELSVAISGTFKVKYFPKDKGALAGQTKARDQNGNKRDAKLILTKD